MGQRVKHVILWIIAMSGVEFAAGAGVTFTKQFDFTSLPFSGNGPFGRKLAYDTITIEMPPSTKCQRGRCQISATIEVPEQTASSSETKFPVVIVSPGFMVGMDRYETYAGRLTSWGYITVRWETQGEYLPFYINSHATLAKMIEALVSWVQEHSVSTNSPLQGLCDLSPGVLLVGHSRGAKANSLMAAWNTTAVAAVVNLDPVDVSGFDSTDDQALPILSNASAAFLTVGSQLGAETFAGTACAPAEQGFRRFYAESDSPAWMVEVLHAGHMQFLDDAPPGCIQCGIMRAICVEGPLPDWVVREVSQTAMIAWFKHVLDGADLSPYLQDWAAYLDTAGIAFSHFK